MKNITFSELTLKDLTLKNLMIIIRFTLLSILFVLMYFILWYFIYKIGNEYINYLGPIICLIIGWKILSYYEDCINSIRLARAMNGENIRVTYNFEIYPLLKLVLTPIVIPLVVSAYVCDFISNCIYKDNVQKNENANTKFKTVEELEKNWKEYEIKYKSNNNSITSDYGKCEEEYNCEICLNKITEEEYELYDCMCEECFEEQRYNNTKI